MKITITRLKNSPKGCVGRLEIDKFSLHSFHTLENCDRFLDKFPSSKIQGDTAIPIGLYKAKFIKSPKFGMTFWLQDVPNFSEILCTHVGNTNTDTKGCILIGKSESNFVLKNSKDAQTEFLNLIQMAGIKENDNIEVEIKRLYTI